MDILEPKAVTKGKLSATVRRDHSLLDTKKFGLPKRKQFDSRGEARTEQFSFVNSFMTIKRSHREFWRFPCSTIFVRPKSFVAAPSANQLRNPASVIKPRARMSKNRQARIAVQNPALHSPPFAQPCTPLYFNDIVCPPVVLRIPIFFRCLHRWQISCCVSST